MKARCVKGDPLGLLEEGRTYEYRVVNGVYLFGGIGVSREQFEVMFEKVPDGTEWEA